LYTLLGLGSLPVFGYFILRYYQRNHRVPVPFPGIPRKQFIIESFRPLLEKQSDIIFNEKIFPKVMSEEDPVSQLVIQIGKRLIDNCGIPEAQKINWRFYVLKDPLVNCFSLGNGIVVVQLGMLDYTSTLDEVAAALAHEISHILARHVLERVSLILGYQNQEFQQTQEVEADYIGLTLMVRAGFDPNEAINLWRKLAKILPDQDNPKGITFFSHPSFRLRLENAQEAIPLIIENHTVPAEYFKTSSLPEPNHEEEEL